MAIETDFDIPFISALALREKQIQQNYRPIIAVHKWFARRPGTLFRGLLLSEYSDQPLREVYYRSNDLSGLRIADPFMGGGTPLLEANRLGCDVLGFDINPMAYWIVKEEIEHINLDEYLAAARKLVHALDSHIGHLFRTTCLLCSRPAPVKYFLWVKVIHCEHCGMSIDLFPGYLLSTDARHPKQVFVCCHCGALNERSQDEALGRCDHCSRVLADRGTACRNKCACPNCGTTNRYPTPSDGPPSHRLFAIEYHCPNCKPRHKGRFFKAANGSDLALAEEAEKRLRRSKLRFVPDQQIPPGDETNRLHRWGYRRYRDMFNARQLLGLELSCRLIAKVRNERIRSALATNLSDLLRYQNMLCRYDTMALKSLDIFSIHGFPVGLVQCESNLLGLTTPSGRNIGSGGWANVIRKFSKAKAYCDRPFEVRHEGGRKRVVYTDGERIGNRFNGMGLRERKVELVCTDSTSAHVPRNSLDGVFTDPPYFGNVQYAELMDFCYVWLRKLIDGADRAFCKNSTRDEAELTGNVVLNRGIEEFATGLSRVFCRMANALRPGRPLVFTFHHNDLAAYVPIAVAMLDAGLACTASLPCPAEMSASIHISGTKSSIVDTVFVCRSRGTVDSRQLVEGPEALASLVHADIQALAQGRRNATAGDTLCIISGHLTRLVVWALRSDWDLSRPVRVRLEAVRSRLHELPAPQRIKKILDRKPKACVSVPSTGGLFEIPQASSRKGGTNEISF